MQVVAGLLALVCAILWIGYLALSVMTISDPNAERALAWVGSTPAMALVAIGTLWVVDRFGQAG